MNSTLRKKFENLEVVTAHLIKEVSGLSSATYHFNPSNGKWSVSQILTHLLVAERLSLSYMKKKALSIDSLDDTGLSESLKFLVLVISQHVPLKYKAPAILRDSTSKPLSFGELVRQWQELRNEMKTFLETIEDHQVRKKIYKHPRVGMLNVCQGIQFLADHLHHHYPQVKSIIKSRNSN